jgi:hypothetical protein
MNRIAFPEHLRWALAALPIQVLAYLALGISTTLIYGGDGGMPDSLVLPITYMVLVISGLAGGGAALIGLYKVLAHSRAWVAALVIGLLLAPSLVSAWASVYALLVFMAAI